MKINSEDLISVTDASRQGVSKLVNDASGGRDLVLIKNNRPAAAIVGIEKLERLQRLEEYEEDIKLLTVAIVRSATEIEPRVDLDAAAARFGIDLDELDGEDEEG